MSLLADPLAQLLGDDAPVTRRPQWLIAAQGLWPDGARLDDKRLRRILAAIYDELGAAHQRLPETRLLTSSGLYVAESNKRREYLGHIGVQRTSDTIGLFAFTTHGGAGKGRSQLGEKLAAPTADISAACSFVNEHLRRKAKQSGQRRYTHQMGTGPKLLVGDDVQRALRGHLDRIEGESR